MANQGDHSTSANKRLFVENDRGRTEDFWEPYLEPLELIYKVRFETLCKPIQKRIYFRHRMFVFTKAMSKKHFYNYENGPQLLLNLMNKISPYMENIIIQNFYLPHNYHDFFFNLKQVRQMSFDIKNAMLTMHLLIYQDMVFSEYKRCSKLKLVMKRFDEFLSTFPDVISDMYDFLTSHFSHVKSLFVGILSSIIEIGPEICRCFPNLIELSFNLYENNMSHFMAMIRNNQNIQHLEIFWQMLVVRLPLIKQFVQCISTLPSLRCLKLNFTWMGYDEHYNNVRLKEYSNVQWTQTLEKVKLEIQYIPQIILDDGFISMFTEHMDSVQKMMIVMQHNQLPPSPILAKNVKNFTINYVGSSPKFKGHFRLKLYLKELQQLNTLVLLNFSTLNASVFASIGECCPNLLQLQLSGNDSSCYEDLHDFDLVKLLGKLPKLERLVFRDEIPRPFCPATLRTFAERAKQNSRNFYALVMNFVYSYYPGTNFNLRKNIEEELEKVKAVKNLFYN